MTTKVDALRRVLITGGAGQIGLGFAADAQGEYDFVLLDLPGRFTAAAEELGEVIEADITDSQAMRSALAGVDTVIHLGGFRQASTRWADLLPVNIAGTYNVVAAAIANECSRFIFASSVHAVSGYAEGRQLREEDPVNPADLYGVSKVFGEALGRYAAEQEGLSFIALRVGAFQYPDLVGKVGSGWMVEEYCAPADLYQLLRLCIEHDDITFEIFNAASANRLGRMDTSKAQAQLGYVPLYDSFELSGLAGYASDNLGSLTPPSQPSGMREDVAPTRRTDTIADAP
ncbi:NAD-dependent epimerase/dehydratase family protein [Microbacterium sp. A196]|uniref:NAD-dependent epimerase/dehydratase family protein n=1 Tax=Microbacterium sp. A196 TaxID=3457320 RepID=UPI003FCF7493